MPRLDTNTFLTIVIRCNDRIVPRVRYVFDTLFMARGIPVKYASEPPLEGIWIRYAPSGEPPSSTDRCVTIVHHPDAWQLFDDDADVESAGEANGLPVIFSQHESMVDHPTRISFDLVANAFYFLSSWSERKNRNRSGSRQLHATSAFARLGIPQDIVDQYLDRIWLALAALDGDQRFRQKWDPRWPGNAQFAVALSHDVDFLPVGSLDNVLQGGKSILRHLIRQRDPKDALLASVGLAKCLLAGRDPYGCVPEIIAEEKRRGVRSSFQVAVARRHAADVNYDVNDDRTRDYLRAITNAEFDLCLHGSYRSTERRSWYTEEVELLSERLGRPLGSRQHFLSFDYDTLFAAQEDAGIQYDMSMGFPDRCGPRAGFSYPYFPFNFSANRPFDVVEISLFYMDVTLHGYMNLRGARAREVIDSGMADLSRKCGAVSVVWHPIVFGSARDPGYDQLYWYLIERVQSLGGLATDGRTINNFWRERARNYVSFA